MRVLYNVEAPYYGKKVVGFGSPDSNPRLIRVARLELLLDSGRPTQILVGFASPNSNCCSIRVARRESSLDSGRPTRIAFLFGSPTRIVFRFGSPGSNPFSVRVAPARIVFWAGSPDPNRQSSLTSHAFLFEAERGTKRLGGIAKRVIN